MLYKVVVCNDDTETTCISLTSNSSLIRNPFEYYDIVFGHKPYDEIMFFLSKEGYVELENVSKIYIKHFLTEHSARQFYNMIQQFIYMSPLCSTI